jgi:hypothetical protein
MIGQTPSAPEDVLLLSPSGEEEGGRLPISTVDLQWQPELGCAPLITGEKTMDTTNLTAIVGLLIALSVASERLVEIIKGVIPPLNKENSDVNKEGVRRAALQVLAVAAGVITAFLARPSIPEGLIPADATGGWPVFALGLLASGGSGFWNSVLTYVTKAKEVKSAEAAEKKRATATQ